MLITALILAFQAEPAPQHSAQCLMEVAALSGETFAIADDRKRNAAIGKADQLMSITRELILARDQLIDAQATFMIEVGDREIAGELPPGSADVERARMAAEVGDIDAALASNRLRMPSCAWPT